MDERAQEGGGRGRGREREWAYIAPRLKKRAGAWRAGRPTPKGGRGRAREAGSGGGCLQVMNLRLDKRNFGPVPYAEARALALTRVSCTNLYGYVG